jgi:hypothetical protein
MSNYCRAAVVISNRRTLTGRTMSELAISARRAAAALLPQPVKAAIKAAIQPQAPVVVAAPSAPVTPGLPMQITQLETLLEWHDGLAPHLQNDYVRSVFEAYANYPEGARIIATPYCQARFANHRLFKQILSAYHLGTGDNDLAFRILDSIDADEPSAFNAVMAARCLMRPQGREKEVVVYLTEMARLYPNDIYVICNLATAHFCLGNVEEANRILAPVRGEWKAKISDSEPATKELAAELETALSENIHYRKFRYDEMSYQEHLIKEHWEPYFSWMNLQPPHLMFGWLKNFYRDAMIDILKSDPDIREMINFGVMCGQAEYEAGNMFPRVRFVGVDRQHETARLNTLAYPLSNLQFKGEEIEDTLAGMDNTTQRAVFHGRTATLCYPRKMRELYKLCASKGVKYILLFENCSLSHKDHTFYSPDQMPADAIIYKNDQFVHNYRKLLEEAGYSVIRSDVMFSPLVSPFSDMDLCSTHSFIIGKLN